MTKSRDQLLACLDVLAAQLECTRRELGRRTEELAGMHASLRLLRSQIQQLSLNAELVSTRTRPFMDPPIRSKRILSSKQIA